MEQDPWPCLGEGGGGIGGGGSGNGPTCNQIATIGGTFDNVSTHAAYSVPYNALTDWTTRHVDQVDTEFDLAGIYAGGDGGGGTSISQVGEYTSRTHAPFDSTQTTGSWIDKSGNAYTFTAAASSFC